MIYSYMQYYLLVLLMKIENCIFMEKYLYNLNIYNVYVIYYVSDFIKTYYVYFLIIIIFFYRYIF